MKTFRGIGVSYGIAEGSVVLHEPQKLDLRLRKIPKDQILEERQRFTNVISAAITDIDHLIENYSFSRDDKEILNTHRLILQDPEIHKNILGLITDDLLGIEYAVFEYFKKIIAIFDNMENEYYSQRAADYKEVQQRILVNILGHKDYDFSDLDSKSILIMEEIPTAVIVKMSALKVGGIVSEHGSKSSHSSIIARSLNLPVVVGVKGIMACAKTNDQVIINGGSGEVILGPNEIISSKYLDLMKQEDIHNQKLQTLIGKETITRDGYKIALRSNIELPLEIDQVLHYQSEGIGLFRTEFLYLDRKDLPSEEEQFKIYKEIAEKISPDEIIIRTIDLGGDKLADVLSIHKETNPNLGCRGIRLALQYKNIFYAQIRAILRASAFGKIKVMFPMIASIAELREAKKILLKCAGELKKDNIAYDSQLKIGVMIETPAAAVISDYLARECDFFSIGTNDLVQYTLAVDRDSENISEYYDPYHPAVMQLISLIVQNARKNSIPVSVCGEMASDEDFVPFLVGMGIHELSVSPNLILPIKEVILGLDTYDLLDYVFDILAVGTSEEVRGIIRKWRKKKWRTPRN